MPPLLTLEAIHSYYGLSHVLFDVSLEVHQGECVALLGRNGAGKTTTLKSIMGMVEVRQGRISLNGHTLNRRAPYQIARLGVGFVPEERAIFPHLTVWENLDVARKRGANGQIEWDEARIATVFPRLSERRHQLGGTLSGGEQQQLTIARTLMGNPTLLLLDEPSEGLAPLVVQSIATLLQELKAQGMTMLLAEQNLALAQSLSNRTYHLDDGRIQSSQRNVE
ncbi:MAG: ABC transporter ATP-binding protein [Phototrophicaceae bacterium]